LPDFALICFWLKKAFFFSCLTAFSRLTDEKKIFFGAIDVSISKRGSVVY
jgi:hypothetical protein